VLEPVIDVKMKEKLATVLVTVFHKDGLILNFLTDILVTEINKLGMLWLSCPCPYSVALCLFVMVYVLSATLIQCVP